MIHRLSDIAKNRFLDYEVLNKLISSNPKKYGAIKNHGELLNYGEWTISTWYVNDLVEDYYKAGGWRVVPNNLKPKE